MYWGSMGLVESGSGGSSRSHFDCWPSLCICVMSCLCLGVSFGVVLLSCVLSLWPLDPFVCGVVLLAQMYALVVLCVNLYWFSSSLWILQSLVASPLYLEATAQIILNCFCNTSWKVFGTTFNMSLEFSFVVCSLFCSRYDF